MQGPGPPHRPQPKATPLPRLPALLAARLPFYYGWIIVACVCCAGFARQGPAVATLSIFISPMTAEFGWSRTAISGAVSLGGLLAAFGSPLLGPILDRRGARLMLCSAVLVTGTAVMALSQTSSLVMFYVLFCLARMTFAGPFELGIYGALANWFVERRPLATSIVTLAQMSGLVAMPLIAHVAMLHHGWRAGWLVVGAVVLVVGFVPNWLMMVRRPEDMGLVPDRRQTDNGADSRPAPPPEPAFTRAEAMRTPTFWLLSLFTALIFPVQAGVSLHQAPHLIERGLDPTVAATVISAFSLTSAISGLAFGVIARRLPTALLLALSGGLLGGGAGLMIGVLAAPHAYLAAVVFGLGMGGVLTILPVAWADYFGRSSFGAIRGAALTVQVLSQACGPVLSGVLRDWTGDYTLSLQCFAALGGLSILAALLTRTPAPPAASPSRPPAH
ncbi:MAG: MFS transporter [Hyphomicrobiaceae bacterium]|nr:MFS transporter [Hyphomicrobiaceae bacterium]